MTTCLHIPATAGGAGKTDDVAVEREPFSWPEKWDVFGIGITPTTYEHATQAVVQAASQGSRGLVSCYAVHALMTFCRDESLRTVSQAFDIVTPDGQPVRWALNLLHGARLKDRVYGPEFMLRVCRQAEISGVSIYLYGGSPEVVVRLQANLRQRFPQLKIAEFESPPFRQLTPEEDAQVIERINDSGAGIVFIGLGCPKQDLFAYEHRDSIEAVQVCVGAAFDFHAGAKPTAPTWMQRLGLEWLFRLLSEPRRLWRRYLETNSSYLAHLGCSLLNLPKVLRQRSHFCSRTAHGDEPVVAFSPNRDNNRFSSTPEVAHAHLTSSSGVEQCTTT